MQAATCSSCACQSCTVPWCTSVPQQLTCVHAALPLTASIKGSMAGVYWWLIISSLRAIIMGGLHLSRRGACREPPPAASPFLRGSPTCPPCTPLDDANCCEHPNGDSLWRFRQTSTHMLKLYTGRRLFAAVLSTAVVMPTSQTQTVILLTHALPQAGEHFEEEKGGGDHTAHEVPTSTNASAPSSHSFTCSSALIQAHAVWHTFCCVGRPCHSHRMRASRNSRRRAATAAARMQACGAEGSVRHWRALPMLLPASRRRRCSCSYALNTHSLCHRQVRFRPPPSK